MPDTGTLTLVGTPIGNLGDLSPRAAEALAAADFIAAEDTRVTLKLLNHLGLRKPMISYHEHNRRERGALLLERLRAGENGVLVTDAGMPAISDPGEEMVALCRAKGVPVGVVPGPTAALTALAVSGLPSGRFTFEGFLSTNKRQRKAHLEELAAERRTMLFYEAPHKLPYTLDDLAAAFGGDRRVALARELTKLHEEVVATTLGEAAQAARTVTPRGEYVLVVEGAAPAVKEAVSPEEAAALARRLMRGEGLSASEAARRAAAETGVKKGDIYRLAAEPAEE